MAHLGLIQQQLKTDANYRARFRKDPVAALAEHGLLLSPEMQTQLRSMVAQAQTRPAGVAGAAFAATNFPLQTTPLSGLQTTPIRALQTTPLQTTPLQTVPLIIAFE